MIKNSIFYLEKTQKFSRWGSIMRTFQTKKIGFSFLIFLFFIGFNTSNAQGQFGGKVAVMDGTGFTTWYNMTSQTCDGAGTGNLSAGNADAVSAYLGDKFYLGGNVLTYDFGSTGDIGQLATKYYAVGGSGTFSSYITLPWNSDGTCGGGNNKKYELIPVNGTNTIQSTNVGSYRLDVDLRGNNNGAIYTVYTSGNYIPFTVSALENPTTVSGAASSSSQIDLSWAKWNTKNVMIVRSLTSDAASTAPTQGTIYSVGVGAPQLGTGTVVYKGAGTSFSDSGLTEGVGYTYILYSVNNDYYSSGASVMVNPLATIWNGTAWSNTSGPDATIEAIIDGAYGTTSNGVFAAKKLTVNSAKTFTLNSGTTITVQNEVVNNGAMIIENNANLLQVNAAAVNTGNVEVHRNSSLLKRLDYTLWSSPVAGQNILAFSPGTTLTPVSRFNTYTTATDLYSAFDPTSVSFTAAQGYLIRVPNDADAVTPTAYAGKFTGVLHNGDTNFTLSTALNGYNLVGNPYPSPISMTQFANDNSTKITQTLYFWRKTNGSGTAYCTWVPGVSPPTGTFVSNGNTQSVDPLGIIQTGQGFFVQATASGDLTFKNTQRVANTAGQFFKTKQLAGSGKIWLNATNSAGDFSQMAVTYSANATQGVDIYDGKYINDSPIALTSNIEGGEYTIQSRPAFDATDVVNLNFKTKEAADYTIAIDHTEGVFATDQVVYLLDSKTGAETDLKSGSYTFSATEGVDNARFSLKYQKTLKVDAKVFDDNSVRVYKNNGTLVVNSGVSIIQNIKIFNIQGRLLAEQKNVNTSTASFNNLKASNQALIVQVTSEDNTVVSKKVVN